MQTTRRRQEVGVGGGERERDSTSTSTNSLRDDNINDQVAKINAYLQKTTLELGSTNVELAMETQKLNAAQEQCQALAALVNVTMRRLLDRSRRDGNGEGGDVRASASIGGGGGGSGAAHDVRSSEDWSLDNHIGARALPYPMSAATRAFLESDDAKNSATATATADATATATSGGDRTPAAVGSFGVWSCTQR